MATNWLDIGFGPGVWTKTFFHRKTSDTYPSPSSPLGAILAQLATALDERVFASTCGIATSLTRNGTTATLTYPYLSVLTAFQSIPLKTFHPNVYIYGAEPEGADVTSRYNGRFEYAFSVGSTDEITFEVAYNPDLDPLTYDVTNTVYVGFMMDFDPSSTMFVGGASEEKLYSFSSFNGYGINDVQIPGMWTGNTNVDLLTGSESLEYQLRHRFKIESAIDVFRTRIEKILNWHWASNDRLGTEFYGWYLNPATNEPYQTLAELLSLGSYGDSWITIPDGEFISMSVFDQIREAIERLDTIVSMNTSLSLPRFKMAGAYGASDGGWVVTDYDPYTTHTILPGDVSVTAPGEGSRRCVIDIGFPYSGSYDAFDVYVRRKLSYPDWLTYG